MEIEKSVGAGDEGEPLVVWLGGRVELGELKRIRNVRRAHLNPKINIYYIQICNFKYKLRNKSGKGGRTRWNALLLTFFVLTRKREPRERTSN